MAEVEAFALRAGLRAITGLRRLRMCGASACLGEAGVDVCDGSEGRCAVWYGVLTCNSVHSCPTCSGRIRSEKRGRIEGAMRVGGLEHDEAQWRMLTVTLRHDGSESLLSLRKGVMRAWRRCRQSGTVQRLWKRHVCASVRSIEVTYGENGWHPHLHLVILTTEWTPASRAPLASTRL